MMVWVNCHGTTNRCIQGVYNGACHHSPPLGSLVHLHRPLQVSPKRDHWMRCGLGSEGLPHISALNSSKKCDCAVNVKLRIVKLLFLTHDDELELWPRAAAYEERRKSATALRRIDSWTRSTDLSRRPCLHSHRQDTSVQSEFCSGVRVPPLVLHYSNSATAPTVGGGTHRKATAMTVRIHCVSNAAAKCPQMVGVIHGIRIVWESFHTPVTPRQN